MTGDGAAGGGSPVGTLLRACRLKAGYDLGELSRQLRIRRLFLEAIEDGRFNDLPGHTYAIGFVKTYAEYFGLDPQEIIRRFRKEAGERNGAQALHFPAPVAERGTPRAAIILIGLIIAGIAYGAWYFNTVHDNVIADLVSPVPERLRHLVQSGAGNGGEAGATAETTQSAAQDAPIVVVPVPPRTAPTPALPAPAASAPMTPLPAQAPIISPPAPAANIAPPPTATSPAAVATSPPPSPAPGGGRVVLRAKADSWVQVRDPATRAIVLARVLKAGETFDVPATAGLQMTVGNAGGIEVVIDGESLPPLGREGAVRRNVPLDAGALRQSLAGGQLTLPALSGTTPAPAAPLRP